MKVSDPIIFGHAVRAYFAECSRATATRSTRSAPTRPTAWRACSPRSSCCPRTRARTSRRRSPPPTRRAGARDGRLRPRGHQPARTERRHHRRVDARDDPLLGADVERGGRAAGRQGGDPRLELRGAVRGDDRLLPRARRVRSGDDGHDAQRRPDGPEGGGVRQPRQDVRDRGRRARCAWSTGRARRCSSTRSSRATSGAAARPRTRAVADWVALAVGRARATGAPAVFWLDSARAHDQEILRKVERELAQLDTDGLALEILPVAEATRFTLDRAARGEDTISVTATCCATTSRTCSRSWSWARARRCSRSSRSCRAAGCSRPARAARPPSTCSSSSRRTTCAGTPSASSSRSPSRSSCWPTRRATPGRPVLAAALDAATGTLLDGGSRPRAGWASSTTAAATSTSPGTGRGRWRTRTEDAELAARSRRWPSAWTRSEEAILAELADVQGEPVELGGYYFVDRRRRRRHAAERHVQRSARLIRDAVAHVPAAPGLHHLALFGEVGHDPVEVVLLDAHRVGELGDGDAGARAHELEGLDRARARALGPAAAAVAAARGGASGGGAAAGAAASHSARRARARPARAGAYSSACGLSSFNRAWISFRFSSRKSAIARTLPHIHRITIA